MFTIIEILVRTNSTWSILDPGTYMVLDLINKYDVVLVKLSSVNDALIRQYSLKEIHNIRKVSPSLSLVTYISTLTIPLINPITPIKTLTNIKKVKYSSVWDLNLNANRANGAPNQLEPNTSYTPDIAITTDVKQLTPISALATNLLFMLNGIIFPHTLNGDTLYLKNGYDFLQYKQRQHISALDFTEVGGYSVLDLKDQILTLALKTDLTSAVNISLPNDSLAGKTALLILKGNLKILSTNMLRTTNTTLSLKLIHDELIAALTNSNSGIVDWCNPANLAGDGFNVTTVDAIKYLQEDCYLLIINNDEICFNIDFFHRTDIVGRYSYHGISTGIMLNDSGFIKDYYVSSVTPYGVELSSDSIVRNSRLVDTTPLNKLTGINNVNLTLPGEAGSARVVDIYTL